MGISRQGLLLKKAALLTAIALRALLSSEQEGKLEDLLSIAGGKFSINAKVLSMPDIRAPGAGGHGDLRRRRRMEQRDRRKH